jgi:TM2 domain-containing membrane protein YozV
MALIRCNQCGNQVADTAAACPHCGNPINNYQQPPQNFNAYNAPGNYNNANVVPKNRTTAALLALFLGGVGVHYFYIGKPIPGIVFLVVWLFGWFIGFFPSLIICLLCLVQAIMMFSMTDQQFNEKYVYTQNQFPLF